MRRSALSFVANGSLDIDHVLQSDFQKDVKMIENSEAACIQNMLNNFHDKIVQEKILKPDSTSAKKSSRSSRSTKVSPMKDLATDLSETSSDTNNNVVELKITVNKRKSPSTKSRKTSKTVEEMIPQELSDIDHVKTSPRTFSKVSATKNSVKQIIKNETLQDITNITEKNLQTSTPKKEEFKKTKKGAKKGESTVENEKLKIKDLEKKSKRDVQCKERQKNTKDKQGENSANMLGEEKKTNVKLDNNLKCNNKVNHDCVKLKGENKREKKCKVKAENNTEKNTKPKKCNKSTPNQLKRKKLEKENSDKKLQKNTQSNKSSQKNNAENIKCQCRKSCAKDSDDQCCSGAKEYGEKMREHKKSIKAARAIEDLSRRITVVKKKMEYIKNDLENDESSYSDSSYTDESSYSTDSSSFSDSYSCSSTCSCSYCCSDDYTE